MYSSTFLLIYSDMSIPQTNANSITDIPTLNTTAPKFPNFFTKNMAATVPIAPPPWFVTPSEYAFFTFIDKLAFTSIFPLDISYTLIIIAIHIIIIAYCTILFVT